MPIQSSAARIPSVHSGRLRAASVSSMRSTKTPPCCLANSQLCSAERAPPTWNIPVGDGANRTRTVTPPAYRSPGSGLRGEQHPAEAAVTAVAVPVVRRRTPGRLAGRGRRRRRNGTALPLRLQAGERLELAVVEEDAAA